MTINREIEIKLKVPRPRALKQQLRKLGFRPTTPRHFESNRLFDFPDWRLRKAGCLLRMRFEDGRCLVTFKGVQQPSGHYKVRSEIETRVEDGTRLRKILESLGLRQTFCYEKFRTAYALGVGRKAKNRPVLDFDETPVGTFIELQGPRRWIDEVAGGLNFRRQDYITASYVALYFQWCREQAVKPGNMVFGSRKY